MPVTKAEQDSLHQQELQLVELVMRMTSIKENCERISKTIEEKIAWKGDVTIVEKDIKALEAIVEKQTNLLTWIVRLFFTTMLTGIIGLAFAVVQGMLK